MTSDSCHGDLTKTRKCEFVMLNNGAFHKQGCEKWVAVCLGLNSKFSFEKGKQFSWMTFFIACTFSQAAGGKVSNRATEAIWLPKK